MRNNRTLICTLAQDEVIYFMEEQNTRFNKEKCEIVEEIYQQIYCKFREQYIVVFLCGGASNRGYKSLRDKVRTLLENEKKTLWYNHLKYFIRKIY